MKERNDAWEAGAESPMGDAGGIAEENSFLTRWSRRKLAGDRGEPRAVAPEPEAEAQPVVEAISQNDRGEITDADLPPIDILDENSDYSVFLARKVSAELRRMALRKLFHTEQFQMRCPLNEYSEDYNSYQPLGEIVTHDMRLALERARAQLQAAEEGGELPVAVQGEVGETEKKSEEGAAVGQATASKGAGDSNNEEPEKSGDAA